MASVFASLIPVFLIIATGWLCRATGFVDDKQWIGLERITYVIFFPALIIHTLSQADLASAPSSTRLTSGGPGRASPTTSGVPSAPSSRPS